MTLSHRLFALASLTLAACHGCRPDTRVHVAVAGERAVATVSDRFLSVAVDTAQVVGGNFWTPGVTSNGGTGPVPPFDFARARLAGLARPLGHAYLRVGGTDADRTYYALDDPPPAAPPAGYAWMLTRAEWNALADFARANDFELLFTLDAGAGPRHDGGAWQPDNARALIEYAASRHDPVAVWELGNEINAYPVVLGFALAPSAYAADLATARALVDAASPGAKLAAPASAYWPIIGELNGLLPSLVPLAKTSIDVVTWHFYPQESLRCPVRLRGATPTTLLDPDNLDEIDRWAGVVDGARGGLPAWLGETGNAQCGGAPGVSDTFASSLWWLDELGKMARRGTPVVVRQSLTGADYGLLAEPSLSPRPDYFASLLWRRAMGTRVLSASASSRLVRAYAHCAAAAEGRPGAVSLLAINLDATPVELAIDGLPAADATIRLVTAASLTATAASCNGTPLAADAAGNSSLPSGVAGGETMTLPGRSYAFVTLPSANAPACR
jgi:heparanase